MQNYDLIRVDSKATLENFLTLKKEWTFTVSTEMQCKTQWHQEWAFNAT